MNRTLYIVIFAAVLVAAALVSDAWLSARRTEAQLAATVASQNQKINQVVASENLRATQLAAALATIAEQKRKINTAQQAAAAIPSVLPNLPLSVVIHLPEISEAQRPQESASPQNLPPAQMSIPQADLEPLYDGLQDCRVCSLELDAAKQDLADEQNKAAALTKERDAAIAAFHGGSRWSRLKQNAKWFLIGAAAGTAARSLAGGAVSSSTPSATPTH
jgi:hypothetical protein